MGSLFVIGFGGTGSRILESYIYLCAAGIIREPCHLLLIDPDGSNGNVERCRDQFSLYKSIHRTEPTFPVTEPTLFGCPLNPDGSGVDETFFWEYPNRYQPWSRLLEVNLMKQDVRNFIELLYDEKDSELTFDRGYVGRAHIGSLDLFRVLRSALARAAAEVPTSGAPNNDPEQSTQDALILFFRAFRAAAQGARGVRLAVVGSLFGGTGASGIPAIPPLLRQTFPELRDRIRLACVGALPYFSFPKKAADAPDPAHHPLATQAALYHYSYTDVGFDDIYLVGSPQRHETNRENHLGGPGQSNDAHYVELAAALAIAHFFSSDNEGQPSAGPTVWGCNDIGNGWQAFPEVNGFKLPYAMAWLATTCAFHGSFLSSAMAHNRHRGYRFAEELADGDLPIFILKGQERVVKELHDFGVRFLAWAAEVDRSWGGGLFHIEHPIKEAKLGHLLPGGDDRRDAFDGLMRHLNRQDFRRGSDGFARYLLALSRATREFCASNYRWWTHE